MTTPTHIPENPAAFGKVAVLMGGWAAERPVSLVSGAAVLAALQAQGIDAHGIDANPENVFTLKAQGFDRVFNILHGRGGEDGVLPAILELQNLPYTGSGVLASALAMDKWRTKRLWQAEGLPVPKGMMLNAQSDWAAVVAALGLPIFVKPAREGSSIGMTKVKTLAELPEAYALAAQYDPMVLAESCIAGGGEFTFALLETQAGIQTLPGVRIIPATEFYDYEAKYTRDDTQYLCPCGVSAEQEVALQALALRGFLALGARGWGRVDILLDGEGKPYLLEANLNPGMTSHSLAPTAAKAAGIDFGALVRTVLAGTL